MVAFWDGEREHGLCDISNMLSLFDEVVKPKANDINYRYVSDIKKSNILNALPFWYINLQMTQYN